jgi:predicted GNAT family acetyltransferase
MSQSASPSLPKEMAVTRLLQCPLTGRSLEVSPLTPQHQSEALDFLTARHIHTIIMASYIRDNGLMSTLNRGTFYACRDGRGHLEGVALIGHLTLIETRSRRALEAFARLTRACAEARMVVTEPRKVKQFWRYYAGPQQKSPHLVCRELLYEQQWPIEVREAVSGLRLATLNDLERVVEVHAEVTLELKGMNPMLSDPHGFRLRCVRRIEQGRVWVWFENGSLIFKADVISETPEVTYLEGVYVDPAQRGRGYGLRCFSQLSRILLQRSKAVCLLVNEQNRKAQAFYDKAGYKLHSYYDMIFLPESG